MTAGGRADRTGAAPDGRGLRLGIVVSRFNEHITSRLLAGAQQAIARCGIERPPAGDVVWVPGTWELPIAAQALARSARYDAIVCLGCVIRGETTHDRMIALGAATGLARVALDERIPVTLGVLTVQTVAQAEARSGGARGNKGEDAVFAAVEMARTLRSMRGETDGLR
ncbi:MAG TPA: 6,7-dimethyl-8-ribityllumazine synthase [bacterium]|nr:6,7-dimethyl-8-ribityllumazine synthase [bacterium]